MNKRIFAIAIILVLLTVGFSGCNDVNLDEVLQFSITSFNVEPSIIYQGDTANLSWVVISAQTVTIDNGIGNVANNGKRIIQPSETTTYTLTAINGTKTITATTQIIVKNYETNYSSDITPIIQIVKRTAEKTLTIARVEPSNLKWSDFEIAGNCDTSGLGNEIYVDDTISDCSGAITIRYIPNNTLIGTWTFT